MKEDNFFRLVSQVTHNSGSDSRFNCYVSVTLKNLFHPYTMLQYTPGQDRHSETCIIEIHVSKEKDVVCLEFSNEKD
jgi:hypothetical protein